MGRKKKKKRLLKKLGGKVKNATKKVKKAVQNTATKVSNTVKDPKKAVNNIKDKVETAANNVKDKIEETDISVGFRLNLKPTAPLKVSVTVSNDGDNLNKKIGFKPRFKNLLIKDGEKWRDLLNDRLNLTSSTDIRQNIYYVNGLNTKKNESGEKLQGVKNYFQHHNVKLIYNPTSGLVLDFLEAKKDYDWFLSTNEGKKIEDLDFNWFLSKPLKNLIRSPIENPVTIAVICLLFEGMAHNAPIGIIASSQGSLITFNAIIAFTKLGEGNISYLKKKVKLCHIGTVVPKKRKDFIKGLVQKYEAHTNPKDLLAGVVGLTTKVPKNSGLKTHDVKYYLPMNNLSQAEINKEYNGQNQPFVKANFFVT